MISSIMKHLSNDREDHFIITSCATKRNTHGTLTFEFEKKSMETEIAI